jgi:DNA-3-methyladenine glycosylase I
MKRCEWVPADDALYVAYHDDEWGVPQRDERVLFELLNLEGAQAGLSWSTILRKREGYRHAFADWDIEAIARFGEADVERLLGDAGIVRHRGKIESVVGNARATLALDVPLAELLWAFVGGQAVCACA